MSPLPGDVQWFPAEIRRLIVSIKKQEGLYNPKHENFGLREFHSKAWKQVATEVGGGKTDIQCRDKWNCLRGTYRRHVRTEVTNNVKRRSGWPWAEMLTFIRPYVLDKEDYPRETRSPPKSASPNGPPALTPITLKSANNILGTQGLTFTGGIVNGGLILTQNRMGGLNLVQPNQLQGNVILQPSQAMGILQPNQINLVRPNQPTVAIMNPSQKNVTMGVMQPKLIAVSSASAVNAMMQPIQSKATNTSTVTSSSGPKAPSPIEIDLSKVKPDPDAPPGSPERTEFVDMDISMKQEPLEEEELQLPDFLSEDISQDSAMSEPIRENSKSAEESNNSKSSPPANQEEVETDSDSNQLFMKSILAHMNQLSPYDQSMFKMRVQQLLHGMMFPAESRKSVT